MNPENCRTALPIISGILLVVITVMANAYWVEVVRWADKADAAKIRGDSNDEMRCTTQMERAKWIFRLVAILMLLTLLATVVPVFSPRMLLPGIIVDIGCTCLVGVFCLIYASGHFFIPLR
jgi:drug/metabolite transporter (DMT)-like permease